MKRAWAGLAALATAACIKPSPETTRAADEDPCFTVRDAAQDLASRTGHPGSVERFRAIDATCEKRAALLIEQATTLRADRPERALELLERAIVIASRNGDALAQARDLREVLLVEMGVVAGDTSTDVEATAYLQDAAEFEREGDWASARDALRGAMSYGQNDAIQERLREVEARCRLEANKQLTAARGAEAAGEIDRAYDHVDQALVLADPDSIEADEAYEILERLDAAANAAAGGEYDTGIGDLPDDPRPPPLDGSQVERMARAREAEANDDWLTARFLWRQLSEEYASNAEIEPALERAESKCLLIARRLVIEAKAYEAASNYREAANLVELALRHADHDGPEHVEAETMQARLRRETTPVPPAYDVPPADAPLAALLRAGEVSMQRQDWLAAREIYRRALSTNPGDESVAGKLDVAHAECIRMARRQISEAKAYEAAYNFPEALKALRLARLYADRDTDLEHEQAQAMEARIRNGARSP